MPIELMPDLRHAQRSPKGLIRYITLTPPTRVFDVGGVGGGQPSRFFLPSPFLLPLSAVLLLMLVGFSGHPQGCVVMSLAHRDVIPLVLSFLFHLF